MNESFDEVDDHIAIYCGWLACGKLIAQTPGRGRRKEFCSDICRRAADRDYKRVKVRVEVFEEQLRRSQHHVAAYGRKAEEGSLTPEGWAAIEGAARIAFARAEAVVELGAAPERIAHELEALVGALKPLLDHRLDPSVRSA